MELALYDPDWGYYSSGKVALGPQGDFTTSPEVDPAFGLLLARFVARCDQALGQPDVFTLSEFGSGSGRLLASLLDELKATESDLYNRLQVRIIEYSAALRLRQSALLKTAGHSDKISWQDSIGGVGLVLSNEVVDAFPVHRVIMRDGVLRELYVGLDDAGNLAELEDTLSTPALADYFTATGIWPSEGQRTEVNLDALDWLARVGRDLERGFVLTIDYGDTAERLYSDLRPEGTLLSYTKGKVTENPFVAPGEMDITAHADFTALMRQGDAVGLKTLRFMRQYEFLADLGIGDMIASVMSATVSGDPAAFRDTLATRERLFRLIDPDGLGRFHVLLQGKDAELT